MSGETKLLLEANNSPSDRSNPPPTLIFCDLPSSALVEVAVGHQEPLEFRGEEEGVRPPGGLEEGQEHHLVLDHTS
jgi:hypothetical protein